MRPVKKGEGRMNSFAGPGACCRKLRKPEIQALQSAEKHAGRADPAVFHCLREDISPYKTEGLQI